MIGCKVNDWVGGGMCGGFFLDKVTVAAIDVTVAGDWEVGKGRVRNLLVTVKTVRCAFLWEESILLPFWCFPIELSS